MRKIRRIRKLKYNTLVRARLIKLNYTWFNRTLRKKFFKKKTINYGLMRVGGVFFKNFNKFLKPSFHFTCYVNNSIIANIYPSLSIPKTTISSPKYFFYSKNFFEAYGNSTRFLLPKFFYKNIAGLKCLLLSNSYKALKDDKDLELKKIFYKKNYLVVNCLVTNISYGTLTHSFKKSKISIICSAKSLLLLFFY
tara:strand:+ start:1112 stop:1693 length:582 start_codon:yes stop_codon:yes gene_type:complete